jgi:hypothetical protein
MGKKRNETSLLTKEQSRLLARYERNSYKVIGRCWQCLIEPKEKIGFSWAAIALLDGNNDIRADEIFVVRYEFLHSETEKIYKNDSRFKSVSFTFIFLIFIFFGLFFVFLFNFLIQF